MSCYICEPDNPAADREGCSDCDARAHGATDDEPCLCGTGFTCMSREHEDSTGLSDEHLDALADRLYGILAWEPGPNQTLEQYSRTVAEYVAPLIADMLLRESRRRITHRPGDSSLT